MNRCQKSTHCRYFNAFVFSASVSPLPLGESCRRFVFHRLCIKVDDEVILQIFLLYDESDLTEYMA